MARTKIVNVTLEQYFAAHHQPVMHGTPNNPQAIVKAKIAHGKLMVAAYDKEEKDAEKAAKSAAKAASKS